MFKFKAYGNVVQLLSSSSNRSQPPILKFHRSAVRQSKELVTLGHTFDAIPHEDKNKEGFHRALSLFLHKNVERRGYIDFIKMALRNLEAFGVHRDLDTYKALLNLFPKGKMVPKNAWQRILEYYPREMWTCLELFEEMEYNFVDPDKEMFDLVISIFGEWTKPSVHMKSMAYWKPKLRNVNEYLPPRENVRPDFKDPLQMAIHAVKMMCRDPATQIDTYYFETIDKDSKESWLVSGQSPKQISLISSHPLNQPIYVDGPFRVFVWDHIMSYFMLVAEADPRRAKDDFWDSGLGKDDQESLDTWHPRHLSGRLAESEPCLSMHEQSDGTVFSLCCMAHDTPEYQQNWVKFLQNSNPRLAHIPVVFRDRQIGLSDLILSESQT